uniref:TYW2 N-terminal domain-containing protein n=1 Tax=Athene cunicularia TaxID=194338 RepID=A0A663MPL5_ATHCN
MEARDVPIPVPALATELQFAQRLRKHLEEEQLLDGRYRLQEVPGGRVALPVLEEKLSQLRLPTMGRWGLSPHATSLPQDPLPSRAARRQTPAQKLKDQLRRLLGQTWTGKIPRLRAPASSVSPQLTWHCCPSCAPDAFGHLG